MKGIIQINKKEKFLIWINLNANNLIILLNMLNTWIKDKLNNEVKSLNESYWQIIYI